MFSSNTTQVSDGGYQISRSLRFNSADTAYLSRTPASASNRKTWTWSAWVKRSSLSSFQYLFFGNTTGGASGTFTIISFGAGGSADQLRFQSFLSNTQVSAIRSTAVYRDPSAWYHIVVAVDTTQATASNRIRMYVNNAEITSFAQADYPAQNTDLEVNNNVASSIGDATNSANYNGYMTEINFIDGTQLTPSSFGETNAQTGVWQPKAYSGSYGTNGFYLNFSDNSNTTAATLGKDYSGNGNNWTPNNFSVTAGAGNDSLVDSPTSYGTDTGVGGTVRGNYATFNPLVKLGTSNLSNGNLDSGSTAPNNSTQSTIAVTTGKWYAEFAPSGQNFPRIGIQDVAETNSNMVGSLTISWGGYNKGELFINGTTVYDGSQTSPVISYTAGDIIGIAIDADTRKVWFSKNGTWQNFSGSGADPVTGTNPVGTLAGSNAIAYAVRSESCTVSGNFGQRPFAYTAPSGFKALCTQNLPTPTIGATTATQAGKYFNAVTYTGTGSSLGVTGVGFQPDWVWVKGRSGATDHGLYDAVRGVQKQLESNNTGAETTETTGITSFGSDGFTTGSLAQLNTSSATYVAWNWKANGSGSTNTAGTVTSTVSANTTSGFSVVTYTGTGAVATVGHGLSAVPRMIIVKSRSVVVDWVVYHASTPVPRNNILYLSGTQQALTVSNYWGTSDPTSSVFGLNSFGGNNQSGATYVAYCFAEVAGYSKFGSYTGNGSTDGVFVYTSMRPAYVMIKRTDTTGNWIVWDTVRNTYNVMGEELYPNLSNAGSTATDLDVLSNGFKLRNTTADFNASGGTYIFMALASNPFKYSLAR